MFDQYSKMPTVLPKKMYSAELAEVDASNLKEAMKGLVADEKSVINILANRSCEQRQEIISKYFTLYSKNLVDDLKGSFISNDFSNTVFALLTPQEKLYARDLRYALTASFGNHKETLCEILCSLEVKMLIMVKTSYLELYEKTLEIDIQEKNYPEPFERFLLKICDCQRAELTIVDPAQIEEDVDAIYEACKESETSSNDSISFLTDILTRRSLVHLRGVFDFYHILFGDIRKSIKDAFSTPLREAFCIMISFAFDSYGFFAERLYYSMVGFGTRDRDLIRLIVTRAEVDLGDVKVAFLHMYGKTLESFIEGDCSGDYKKMLLALTTPSVLKTT